MQTTTRGKPTCWQPLNPSSQKPSYVPPPATLGPVAASGQPERDRGHRWSEQPQSTTMLTHGEMHAFLLEKCVKVPPMEWPAHPLAKVEAGGCSMRQLLQFLIKDNSDMHKEEGETERRVNQFTSVDHSRPVEI